MHRTPHPLFAAAIRLLKPFSRRIREPRPKTIRPDDVFIVSYPKSGNTWQRFLVANLLRPKEEVTFLNINEIVADVYQMTDDQLAQLPSPRFLKSHETFTAQYPRAIYITRDPRSVAASMYHFLIATKKVSSDHPLDQFVNAFLRGEYYRNFGSWGTNVTSWLSELDGGNRNILLVRYEDLKKNTTEELRRIIDFLRLNASDSTLQAAVANSSFDKMQALEQTLERLHPRKKWDSGSRFVRKGATEEWKSLFTAEQNARICNAFAQPLQRLSYT